jgi:hypothetical protein
MATHRQHVGTAVPTHILEGIELIRDLGDSGSNDCLILRAAMLGQRQPGTGGNIAHQRNKEHGKAEAER